jgi:formamidase
MKSIVIDRTKRLREQPCTGHNRWHPDIPAIVEVEPGEDVALETRDGLDGQIQPWMTVADLEHLSTKVAHPLTGPVYIKGANPGDLLEVEYLDILPQRVGWTRLRQGGGFLSDVFPEPYLVHWEMSDGWATSSQLPGIRIPEGAFMGTAGIAPSQSQIKAWTRRETDLIALVGSASLPDHEGAVPTHWPIAHEGLRTIPPRENCGNVDAKQLTKGSHLLIPINVEGALYSVGDGHFAQGDSECCLTAIEMGATVVVRFHVHEGEAARHNIRWPRFRHPGYFNAPEWAAPRNFIATIGMPIREDGTQKGGDLTLAARNALLSMIELLQERGWSKEQAYIICSVAVDLKVSNVVNLPNVIVSAFLPEDIFER